MPIITPELPLARKNNEPLDAITTSNFEHILNIHTTEGRQKHELSWKVGPHSELTGEIEQTVTATVPGAVQLDWARAKNWPPFWQGENFREYRWMEDMHWTYETLLNPPTLSNGERLFFVCGGVDYKCAIQLNNEILLTQEGMFTPIEIELTGKVVRGDVLRLTVYPAPKSRVAAKSKELKERSPKTDTWFAWDSLQADNHTQANTSCKPAVSYGWDFHPRLIPLGIWQETFLEVRQRTFLDRVAVDYRLSDDLTSAEIFLDVETDPQGRDNLLRWSLLNPQGEVVFDETLSLTRHRATVKNPALWWPHDHGTPDRYISVVELVGNNGEILDTYRTTIGFRRVKMIMAPNQWAFPMPQPNISQRGRPPMTLEINGRAIFGKGANWVSPEIFPGLLNPETYTAQLSSVHSANMNLLRMWGGAPIQKKAFYDKCDELGIMVWQDFPLSCNNYPDDAHYLRVLDQESRSIISTLKSHPSVVIWCGGNELFNSWSGMTDQSLAIRLLQSNCYQLDPSKPFLATTPLEGVGHGHYVFRDPQSGKEAWSLFQQSSYTAYCEFGCPGPALLDVIREIIPPAELFPPKPEGSWKAHHAFAAWMKTSHLYTDNLEHYFGPTETLEQLVERGHLLQCEGYKGLFEEARRQKPVSSMALCWCLNEPWPSAANNSLISWPSRPKPALAAVGTACRPLMASARIRKFQWSEGEDFDPEIFWLNDTQLTIHPGPVNVRIETVEGKTWPLLVWNGGALTENRNLAGPKLHLTLPNLSADRFELILETPERPEATSRYTLLFRR